MSKSQKKIHSIVALSILGEKQVGKTTICKVFMGLEFTSGSLATIGIDKLYSEMVMDDGNKVKIKLWDTAGQERFRSISLSTVKHSKGIIVVFDVCDKASFDKLDYWIEIIKNESDTIPIVLFGNKCDREDRQVTTEDARNYAEKRGLLYFETSAKTNQGLNEGFKSLVEIVYSNNKGGKGFKLDNQGKDGEKKGGCCGGKSKEGKENKKNKENRKSRESRVSKESQ